MDVDTCVCARLRRATRVVTKLYDDALSEAGVNATQFAQLHMIATLESPTLGQLSRETCLDRSTMGRNVRVLVKMDLVKMASGSDERTRVISLTGKGEATYEKGSLQWKRAQMAAAGILGELDRQNLFELLDRVEEASL